MTVVRVAAVQAAPVFLDLDATVARALDLIEQAADAGAELVCFPETFLPAYPDWVWRTTPWSRAATDLQQRLYENAVDVPGPVTSLLGEAAARHQVHLVMGLNEREGGTLYNSTVYFGPDGGLLGKHRKLVPTGGERLVWGMGDGSTLDVFDTAIGRLGGLICWENYMPLARAALYERRVDLYVAPTWDNSDVWVPTLQHIAKEGRCFVIGVNFCLRAATSRTRCRTNRTCTTVTTTGWRGATPRSSTRTARSSPGRSSVSPGSSPPTSTWR